MTGSKTRLNGTSHQTRPSFAVGTSLVSLEVKALRVAMMQITAVKPTMIFQPPPEISRLDLRCELLPQGIPF